MLILALPITIWALTGSYFVLMDLSFIRSDHVRAQYMSNIVPSKVTYPISEVYQRYTNADEILLKVMANTHYYQVQVDGESILLDANHGELVTEISKQQAIGIAQEFQHQQSIPVYAKLINVELIKDLAPIELAKHHLPVWRLDFDDNAASTIYLSSITGDVVAHRHDYWRVFDLFWKWHIMDYDDGEAIDNKLLLFTSLTAIVAVSAGTLLIWQRRRKYM